MNFDPFIYGKDDTEGVVSVQVKDDRTFLYLNDGTVKEKNYMHWLLYHSEPAGHFYELDGDLHYKYAKKFDTLQDQRQARAIARNSGEDVYCVYNPQEAFLIKTGVTYYKGLEPLDVSVLSFDIETSGLTLDNTSKVYLISNTYRDKVQTVRRLFSIDDYDSQEEMIDEWCKWVQEINPSILTGHYVFGFDLPYLDHCSRSGLALGRDCSTATFNNYTSQFRKDGSQSYDYQNVTVQGREIVDTKFLAIKADIGRRYPSYSLKPIIKFEGLERADRQHWDFGNLSTVDAYNDPELWVKFKEYAEHDADDALALFDLLIPPYFYYAQSIPKTMQQIINGASGAQVNSFMVRAYLSEKHSIPKASEPEKYEGGISFGNPGAYGRCYKVDVASLYPSIIRQYEVYDADKDPKRYFLKMVSNFTDQRLKHKELAKTSGDRSFKDREQAEKILINSAYGFMGAPGLNFNSPKCAAEVTRKGREILEKGIEYCKRRFDTIVNADTDSFMFHSSRPFSFQRFIEGLNQEFPNMIRWEDDGVYSAVLIVKAKNYVLQDLDGNVTIKGSALKATMKEPALRRFIDGFIQLILGGHYDRLRTFYDGYASIIDNIGSEDIRCWSSKKTVTKAVLSPKRTNEARILEAIQNAKAAVNEGDKIFVYFKTETELSLPSSFDGTYCKKTLYRKLFKTVEIFKPVIDMSLFPNYALKRNQEALKEVIEMHRDTSDDKPRLSIVKKEVSETTGASA